MNICYNEEKQFHIKLDYPPLVDATYEQLSNLIRHLEKEHDIKDKNIVITALSAIKKLEEQEKYPVTYMKKFIKFFYITDNGQKLLSSKLINKVFSYSDYTDYPEEEVLKLKELIDKELKEYDPISEGCPFPLSKELILLKKKDILKSVYVQIELSKNKDAFMAKYI